MKSVLQYSRQNNEEIKYRGYHLLTYCGCHLGRRYSKLASEVYQLNFGSSSVQTSHRSSKGYGFEISIGLRNRFSEVRAWWTFINLSKISPSSTFRTLSHNTVFIDEAHYWTNSILNQCFEYFVKVTDTKQRFFKYVRTGTGMAKLDLNQWRWKRGGEARGPRPLQHFI